MTGKVDYRHVMYLVKGISETGVFALWETYQYKDCISNLPFMQRQSHGRSSYFCGYRTLLCNSQWLLQFWERQVALEQIK